MYYVSGMNFLTILAYVVHTDVVVAVLNRYCGLLCVNHVFLKPPLVFYIERLFLEKERF